MIRSLSREVLHHRHRLSHQQIDQLLNENTGKKFLDEKIQQLNKISLLIELSKRLNEENIWFLVLKGPLLSERIYGDPTTRLWKDFDLLTKPALVGPFVSVLLEMGFQHAKVDWPKSEKRQQMILHFGKNLELYNPTTGISVEVHWKLFDDRLTDYATMWKLIDNNTEETTFSGETFKRLSLEFELLYLIIHGSIHAWFRLKWLVDIKDFLEKQKINEDKFLSLCGKLNAFRFVCIYNYVMNIYFPSVKSLPMNKQTNCKKLGVVALEDIRKEVVHPTYTFSETIRAIRYKMALSPSLRYKLDVLRLVTFGKPDLQFSWIPDHPFFFYLFRPFGLIIRKVGKL